MASIRVSFLAGADSCRLPGEDEYRAGVAVYAEGETGHRGTCAEQDAAGVKGGRVRVTVRAPTKEPETLCRKSHYFHLCGVHQVFYLTSLTRVSPLLS